MTTNPENSYPPKTKGELLVGYSLLMPTFLKRISSITGDPEHKIVGVLHSLLITALHHPFVFAKATVEEKKAYIQAQGAKLDLDFAMEKPDEETKQRINQYDFAVFAGARLIRAMLASNPSICFSLKGSIVTAITELVCLEELREFLGDSFAKLSFEELREQTEAIFHRGGSYIQELELLRNTKEPQLWN